MQPKKPCTPAAVPARGCLICAVETVARVLQPSSAGGTEMEKANACALISFALIAAIPASAPAADTATPDSGSDLTSVRRYAAGPCAGRAAGSCTFDTRTFVTLGG